MSNMINMMSSISSLIRDIKIILMNSIGKNSACGLRKIDLKDYAKYSVMAKTFSYILIIILLVSATTIAQVKSVNVKGVVYEGSGNETLPAVSIRIEGSKTAAGLTDTKGAFSVNVPTGSRLVFHIVGFSDAYYEVKGPGSATIRMEEKISTLNEVVIRGYSTGTRELDAGSSTVISGSRLQDVPVSNIEGLLQGKVPGLDIQVNTGAPGYRGTVLVRGLSNIDVVGSGEEAFLNPTSPLYVIDGIPIDVDDEASDNGFNSLGPGISPLASIAPEDVASIEVLKDAQATSLYGSRGAYGVILITTKQGNSTIPRFRYTTNFFVSAPPTLRKTLGGKDERDFKINQILKYGTESDINDLGNYAILSDSLSGYYNNSTNWQDVFYAARFNQSHNIAVEGGSKSFNYKTNLGYYDEKGIVKNTGFNRYSLNTNLTYKPSEKFSVYANVVGSIGQKSKGNGVGLLQNGVAKNTNSSSLLPPPSIFTVDQDIIGALQVNNDNSSKSMRTSFTLNYKPLSKRDLNFSTTGSYDMTTDVENTQTPAAANGQYAKAYAYNASKYTVYNRNLVSYRFSLNKSHEFNFSGFNEIYIKSFQSYASEQTRLPVDTYIGPIGYSGDFVSGSSRGGGMVKYNKSRAASFAASFGYNYKRKYVFNATYRFDANSYSGEEDPFVKNPSLGFKWHFDKEGFFTGIKEFIKMDNGSVRMSWGKTTSPTGNVFTVNGKYVNRGTYNGQSIIGVDTEYIPNPQLGAATSTTYNFGSDFGFFKGRLSFVFDAYTRFLSKQVRDLDLPTMIGFRKVQSNQVSIVNYGYEGIINVQAITAPHKFNWNFSLVGSYNKSYLTKLPGDVNQIVFGNTVFRLGSDPLAYYLFQNDGVYSTIDDIPIDPVTGLRLRGDNNQIDPFYQAGDPIFRDVDGDNVITDKDRVIAGTSLPLLTGGITNNFSWNRVFTLSINSSFTFKRDVINAADAARLRLAGDPFGRNENESWKRGPKAVLPVDDLDFWKNPGDIAKYPNPYNFTRYAITNPFRTNQTLFMEDGSYFKINNITFSYVVPKNTAKRLHLNSLRVFTTVANVATFSKYSGPNPENVSNLGYDNSGGYPVARTFSLGLNMEL